MKNIIESTLKAYSVKEQRHLPNGGIQDIDVLRLEGKAFSEMAMEIDSALNSPAPIDWQKELQGVDAMRMKAIREIEALVGEECEILLPTMVFGFKYVGKSQGTVKLHNTGPGEYIRTLSTELLLTLVSELQKVIK